MTRTDLTENHTHTNRCWWNPDEARWVCPPAGAAPDAPACDGPLVDVRDMLVVHTAMLRELRLLPAAVSRVDAGDRKRAATVARHLTFVCDLLHHHHEGEDLLLWPKLVERTPPNAQEVIAQAEGQHEGIEEALGRVRSLLADWSADPVVPLRDDLAAEVGRLHARLEEHLDLEERALLPLAAAFLSPQEWEQIGQHGVKTTPKPALPLVFGLFAYEGDPAVLRQMLSQAPAVPRTVLPLIAPRLYARRARQVYGTATP